MRRHVALKYDEDHDKIYLYTHWGAVELHYILGKSLNRARSRWDDTTYLARIIFTDMTEGVGDDLTGYGLSPFVTDDEYPTLEVDLQNRKVNDVSYDDFISNPQMFKI